MEAVITVLWDFIKSAYNAGGALSRWVVWFWVAFIFLYWLLGRYEKKNCDLSRKRKPKKKNYYFSLHIFLVLFLVFQYGYYLIGSPKMIIITNVESEIALLNVFGFILLALGMIFVIEGRIELNGYWACDICQYTDDGCRKFVKTGLYKKLRHPIYFGQSTMAFGTALVANNLYIVIFAMLFLFTNIWRAHREDDFLCTEFPTEWPDYKENSWFFFPFF